MNFKIPQKVQSDLCQRACVGCPRAKPVYRAGLSGLISPFVPVFVEIDEGLVRHDVAAGSRVVAREIPVSVVVGNSLVQVFDALIDHLDSGVNVRGGDYLRR